MAAVDRPKSERFDARLTKAQKELIERAAALEGTTVTDFVVRSSEHAALRTIREHELMTLSVRDTCALMDALLNPSPPTEALRRAVEDHRRLIAPRRRGAVA